MRSAGARKVTKEKISMYKHVIFQESPTVNHTVERTRPKVREDCTAEPDACPNEYLVPDGNNVCGIT